MSVNRQLAYLRNQVIWLIKNDRFHTHSQSLSHLVSLLPIAPCKVRRETWTFTFDITKRSMWQKIKVKLHSRHYIFWRYFNDFSMLYFNKFLFYPHWCMLGLTCVHRGQHNKINRSKERTTPITVQGDFCYLWVPIALKGKNNDINNYLSHQPSSNV